MKPLSYQTASRPNLSGQKGLYSETYQDIYFLPDSGVEESRYVFIEGNDLKGLWAKHSEAHFTVAETGFGSGLNLMVLLSAWYEQPTRPKHLHFISCELFPFSKEQIRAAYQDFPQFKSWLDALLINWPSPRAGTHRIELLPDVTLTLLFGQASECLADLEASVDAWFLDGFDPKKNPEMWSDDLFTHMARLSHPETSMATFTAASAVRKGLASAGFKVSKRKGFGRKREMITAQLSDESNKPVIEKQPWAPWPEAKKSNSVTVIGGGIAGLSLTRAFSRAGVDMTLVSKEPLMSGASGNEAGMVMPHLTAQVSPEALFYWRAFEYALNQYQLSHFHPVGVRVSSHSDKSKRWMTALSQHAWPKDLMVIEGNELIFPNAGWVDTQQLKHDWAKDCGANQSLIHSAVQRVEQEGDQWLLFDDKDALIIQTSILILAAGMGSRKIQGLPSLPLTAKHGQTSIVRPMKPQHNLQVIKDQGYVIPLKEDRLLLGASFDHLPEAEWNKPAQLSEDHADRNLALWPKGVFDWGDQQVLTGHAGLRATTPDHLPLCGALIDERQFAEDYADLHHGRHWQQYPAAKPLEGLYVMTGLGSRGFTSAPLMAQVLVDVILGRPVPLEQRLLDVLHPNRFLYRKMKQKP